MTKEQQDLLWQCMSKEARDEARADYKLESVGPFDEGYKAALSHLFCHHNLTSDTEPEEMLMVEKHKVMDFYNEIVKTAEKSPSIDEYTSGLFQGELKILRYLFGDECLPDKEPSAQVEPKKSFNKGDKVKIINVANPMMRDEIGIIEGLPTTDEPRYRVRFEEDHWTLLDVENLEPYTETKSFNLGDKVIVKGTERIGTIKEPYLNDIGYHVYFEDGDGGWDEEYSIDELEPYVEHPEPKFKVGDKVLCKVHEIDIESICTISSYNPKAKEYTLLCGNATFAYRKEDDLKPYIKKI